MDPINAPPAAADHAIRRLIFPPKSAQNAAPFTADQDGPTAVAARKPDQPKPDQVKNREADEEVTRQRTEDKRMGTLFDLRA